MYVHCKSTTRGILNVHLLQNLTIEVISVIFIYVFTRTKQFLIGKIMLKLVAVWEIYLYSQIVLTSKDFDIVFHFKARFLKPCPPKPLTEIVN